MREISKEYLMAQEPVFPKGTPPRWLLVAASVVILFHLTAIAVAVLDAPSGPWLTPRGPNLVPGPAFVESIREPTTYVHTQFLKMAPTFRFDSSYPNLPHAFLEVRLRRQKGDEPFATHRIPDPKANLWVRHRQELLARGLVVDPLVSPPAGDVIPAPGQKPRILKIWEESPQDRMLKIREVPEHLLPRDRQVQRPAEWSLLLVRSFGRYLGRRFGAEYVEIIRHHRDPLPPMAFSSRESPPPVQDLVASYGEVSQ
jgi:hypothetical protein